MLLDVTRFGASAPPADSTSAIVTAIAAAKPGDTVLVPAGRTFLIAPINVSKSDLTLQVDGTLRGATTSIDQWPLLPPLPTYGRDRDGAKPLRHQALLLLQVLVTCVAVRSFLEVRVDAGQLAQAAV